MLIERQGWRRRFFHFRKRVRLADGSELTLRALRKGDREGLRAGLQALSPESSYRRFLMHGAQNSEALLDHLVATDGVDHIALVAIFESLDMKDERGVGVARFIRLPDDPTRAEAAVTVADEMQRKGVGKILLEHLADLARERGIQSFRAEVLVENERMRAILERAASTSRPEGPDVLRYDIALSPNNMHTARTFAAVLAAAAESVTAFALRLRAASIYSVHALASIDAPSRVAPEGGENSASAAAAKGAE